MYEELISIVVPIYNLELYIEDCILSIINQTYKNIEIILINDGSTDNTLNIITKISKYDSRVKIISSVNQGCSNARNLGIDVARGNYIVFVDGDDICFSTMIEYMYKAIKHNKADMCVCNVWRINGSELKTQTHDDDYTIILDDYGRGNYILDYYYNKHAFCVWNRMYDMKILADNKIRFRDFSVIYPEDLLFNLEVLLNIQKVSWINKPQYIHILHDTGLTRGYRQNILFRYLNYCKQYENYLLEKRMYKEMQESFYYIVQQESFSAFISLLRNNRNTLKQLYQSIVNLYNWNFIEESFSVDFSEKFWRKLIVRLINKKHKKIVSIVIYVLYKRKIDFFG